MDGYNIWGVIHTGRSFRQMYLYVYLDKLQADGSKIFCSENIQILQQRSGSWK